MVVDSVPKHLETLVRDRDGPYCTMTMSQASGTRPAPQHVESAHVIPPSMLRDIETAEGGHLISVLEAFISTSHVHRLRKLLSDSVEDNAIFLRNIWLLSPIVHKAFRADHIEVRRIDQLNSSDAEASQTEMPLYDCATIVTYGPLEKGYVDPRKYNGFNESLLDFISKRRELIYDHLTPNRTGGPFNHELELNAYMYSEVGGGQTLAEIYGGEEKIPNGHQSVFTHSDFHYSNLLVDQGRFCGIIDWECADFKPEYWEFTHAGFGSWGCKYEMSLWRRIFGNQYDEILEMEERRWSIM
ncbi:hypothetical protein SS1G_10355 [Sclerotinia sclerotiorum 1980 UF-70]|uniref:Aminoglycoside phosphotransferase domain-containing protein n=1 Tax=Sclerotinia sclerotiorum (strain ATCC 18683 / 1980 / Ss-1) TaxID=665079 RepID=A7EYD9_SCLS1|nr:hypothetical protein SS1G_10355 [Sclerotinia sclerotiorum 1980 UF-70]EDN94481.1 hypothetical protein SS1G_10355 [Sclerotinia sclerotiorum 1980 UF-70]